MPEAVVRRRPTCSYRSWIQTSLGTAVWPPSLRFSLLTCAYLTYIIHPRTVFRVTFLSVELPWSRTFNGSHWLQTPTCSDWIQTPLPVSSLLPALLCTLWYSLRRPFYLIPPGLCKLRSILNASFLNLFHVARALFISISHDSGCEPQKEKKKNPTQMGSSKKGKFSAHVTEK